jgi:hypothetical protein
MNINTEYDANVLWTFCTPYVTGLWVLVVTVECLYSVYFPSAMKPQSLFLSVSCHLTFSKDNFFSSLLFVFFAAQRSFEWQLHCVLYEGLEIMKVRLSHALVVSLLKWMRTFICLSQIPLWIKIFLLSYCFHCIRVKEQKDFYHIIVKYLLFNILLALSFCPDAIQCKAGSSNSLWGLRFSQHWLWRLLSYAVWWLAVPLG